MLPRSSRPPRTARPRGCVALLGLALAGTALSTAQPAPPVTPVTPQPPTSPTTLDPVVVSASRLPQDPATLPLTVETYSAATLLSAPALTLDDTLRRSAAFSLFRRTGSLTANPTAQGVSLRGIGPSGASRALVLVDGVPVNDPFGGWIAWSKLPLNRLERVDIVRGGGSAAWGGSSLGGVIHLRSATPTSSAAATRLTLGDFTTRAADLDAAFVGNSGRDAFRVDAAAFATDGVRLVRNPGPVDIPADSRHARAGLGWNRRINETTTLSVSLRAWEEERGNGTPYQQNASGELAASATLARARDAAAGPAWSFTLHGQTQDFRSTFSSINPARTVETPASDQYSVPSTAAGASFTLTWGDAADLAADAGAVTTLGLDARHVDGETREYFFHDGSDFTRERRAGGAQTVAGLFAAHARPLAPGLTLNLGARLDATRRSGGFLRETDRATSAVLTSAAYADRDDLAFSPSAGLAWRATDTLTVRAAVYSAYRTPTLNELYRPFRIGTITTLAEPDLDPETLLGGELGLAHAAPDASRGLRATVFQNDLSHAVGNITVDATTRRRANLDSVRVRGLELGAHWLVAPALRLEFDYLLSDARVRSGGPAAAALDGKRLAQVPRHTVTAGAEWRATRATTLDLRARWFSAQFEDDQNTLPLGSALRLDLAVRHAITPRLGLTLAIENLLDAEIETARTAAGLVGVAPPRLARAELRYAW